MFPQMRTALLAGALLAFALSFDEVVVTIFTSGAQQTLPIWIFAALARPAELPIVNVVALAVIVASLIPVWFAQRLAGGDDATVAGRSGLAGSQGAVGGVDRGIGRAAASGGPCDRSRKPDQRRTKRDREHDLVAGLARLGPAILDPVARPAAAPRAFVPGVPGVDIEPVHHRLLVSVVEDGPACDACSDDGPCQSEDRSLRAVPIARRLSV